MKKIIKTFLIILFFNLIIGFSIAIEQTEKLLRLSKGDKNDKKV